MKARRTVAVGAAASRRYRLRANEFLELTEDALARQKWNGAGTMAIHAGISAADAVLAFAANLRSREADHAAVLGLLETHVEGFDVPARRHLAGLLRSKNSVEYDDRVVTPTEAKQLVDHARRFLAWAEKTIGA